MSVGKSTSKSVKKARWLKEVYEWIETIGASVIIVAIVFTFLCRVVAVDGHSMENTLMDKDRVIITDLFYTPEIGDIVVLSKYGSENNENSQPLIKRVVAVEGDEVLINYDDGKVYVNGVESETVKFAKDDFIIEEGNVEFPQTVPEGCVFVLGDNRNNSTDSRFSSVGMVPVENILGKAVLRIYPFAEFGLLE